MHMDLSELADAILRETRLAPPARIRKATDLPQLFLMINPIPESQLLIITLDAQEISVGNALNVFQRRVELEAVDMESAAPYLDGYLSWFGEACTAYILGNSVAVFHICDSFSISHILKTSLHEVSISSRCIHPPSLIFDGSEMISVIFTINAFSSDCLSLNAVLSILKHVDPSSVIMVRRVNRLGFDGAKSMKQYFAKFGRVLRIFMLPLKSRKKNISLPPKTGFLVMESAIECARILAHGEEHVVLPGVSVSVGKFTHRALMGKDYDDTL